MKGPVFWLAVFSAVAAGSPAASLEGEPLAELKLVSGKVLKQVLVRSCSSTAAIVTHAEGASTVKYAEFPAEYQAALSARRQSLEAGAGIPAGVDTGEKPVVTAALAAVSYDFAPAPALDPLKPGGDETTLTGEVFVETHDMGNVKLGGIIVSVYSKTDYRRQVAWYFANPWEASRVHTRNAELLIKAGEPGAAMRQFVAATETAATGWQLVEPAHFSTTTDAEGRFTLKHRIARPYFVVAHASRTVDGESEHYRWALISDLIGDPGRVLLFNDTME